MSLLPRVTRFVLAFGLATAAASASAAPVGRVLLSAGDTFAVRDGQAVRLQYNSPIEFHDVLRTGPNSSLQIRFVDEGLISLRENSEFTIEDYKFASDQPEEEKAFFRLVKGGFRSVTGLIGHLRHANYRVQTQTATIGIRGTDYAARICAADCGQGVKDGLYGRVLGISTGTNQVTVTNNTGPHVFGVNGNFFVADINSAPQPLLVPPGFVDVPPRGRGHAAQQGGQGSGGERPSGSTGTSADSRPQVVAEVFNPVTPLTPVSTFQPPSPPVLSTQLLNSTGTPTALPPVNGFVVFYPFSSTFEGAFDDGRIPGTFNGLNQLTGYGTLGTFPAGSLGSGTITDTAQFQLSNGQVFVYGRWTGNDAVTSSIGALNSVPLLFGTATGLSGNAGIDTIGGQASYNFHGGPSPVDAGGNVGTVTSTSFNINFTTQVASLSLGLNFPSIGSFGPAVFSVSGTGTPMSGHGNGDFTGSLSGTCSGGGCASTSASGAYDVGLTGLNGFSLAVVGGGLVNATQAGGVAFLNAYDLASYTPGPLPTVTGTSGLTGQIAFANASSPNVASIQSLPTSQSTYSGSNLVAFNFGGGFTGTAGSIIETGSAALVDGSTINWGRWSGSGTSITMSSSTFNPGTGVPFVVGTSNTIVPTSGSFTYSFAGGPNPTDSAGNIGTWGGGSFVVRFGTTQTISTGTPLTFSVAGNSYSMTGSASVTGPAVVMGNIPLSGTCTGACSAVSGSAAAMLVGPSAGGLAVSGTVFGAPATVAFGGAFKR